MWRQTGLVSGGSSRAEARGGRVGCRHDALRLLKEYLDTAKAHAGRADSGAGGSEGARLENPRVFFKTLVPALAPLPGEPKFCQRRTQDRTPWVAAVDVKTTPS